MREAVQLRYDRDTARARLIPLQAENERLRMLLRYAEEAIMAEYQLRIDAAKERQDGV